MDLSTLPTVNASLNAVSTGLLILGRRFIRLQRPVAHRNCMLAALVTSALFLCSYLYYHSHAGRVVFSQPGWFRPIYLVILGSHTILAGLIVPAVLLTLSLALAGRFATHRRIALWTWPVWIYVSATGVLIYLLLYWVFPQR